MENEEKKVEEVKPEQKKKGKAGIIVAIVAVIVFILLIAVLAIAGLIVFFVVKPGSKTTTVPRTSDVNRITITFETNCEDSVRPMDVIPGEEVNLPTPIYDGHTFDGWYLEDNTTQVTNEYEFTQSITVYAHWTEIPKDAKTLTVTFDSKGGSKVKSMKFVCTDNAATLKNLPKPTKTDYDFRAWEDKHGKAILDGASIICDGDLTLYAAWEKKETPSKKYSCSEGTLNGDKCEVYGTVHENCPSGTKVDGTLCIKTSDTNAGTRQCVEDTVSIDGKGHTWTGKGDYFFGSGHGQCAYYKWDAYTTKTQCDNAKDIYHSTVWVTELNGCYAKKKDNNYETVCSGDYQYYSSAELSSKFGLYDNGKCLRKIAKEKSCDSGFTLTGDKCIKTTPATEVN